MPPRRIIHYGFTPALNPNWFVSIWKTDETSGGSSASNQVKLPLTSAGTYDFTVDWGDGNTNVITSWNQTEVTHTYAVAGKYTIICKPNGPGQLRGFAFNNSGDRLKFLDVIQFGGLQLVNNQGQTFFGCANFTGASISDVLDTVGHKTTFAMYAGCTSYNGPVNFDTSSVTNMTSMFQGASSFNQPVNFDTSSVTTMHIMFEGASSFNQPINFNTSLVNDMSRMFRSATNFNQPVNFNTSLVTTMGTMFFSATSFNQDISTWDIDQVTNFANFMGGPVTLSTANYDALLLAWASQIPLSAVGSISFGGSKYTGTNPAVVAARAALVAEFSSFSDGGPV